jgi:hypothetical protein
MGGITMGILANLIQNGKFFTFNRFFYTPNFFKLPSLSLKDSENDDFWQKIW